MKHSEILRAAKEHLWYPNQKDNEDYCSQFICDCVMHVSRTENLGYKGREITGYISSLINFQFGIDRWLVKTVGVDPMLLWHNGRESCNPTKALQDYRLAWMEHMAQEYESKGM